MPKRRNAAYYGARRARKRQRTSIKYRRARPMSNAKRFRRSRFRTAVMRVVNRHAETKEVMIEHAKNQTVKHNVVLNLSDNAFRCSIGSDGGNHQVINQRDGNRAFVKGFKVSLMLENQQYRPLVTYWLYLIRRKGGQADSTLDSKEDMFEGISTTIPMDYIDTDRVDVIACKKFTVRMPNSGTTLAMSGTANGAADLESAGASYEVVTNPQLIKKMYIPINKKVQYHDSDNHTWREIPASYRAQWVLIAYDNFSTTTDGSVYPVGHVSMTTIMKFTDV